MLQAILDYLSSEHGHGRHGGYGWTKLLPLIVFCATALAANELRSRRILQMARLKKTASTAPMVATAVITQAQGVLRLEASIVQEQWQYRLKISQTINEQQTNTEYCFEKLEEVRDFLETQTPLRLGDFKSKAKPSA